VIHYDGTSWERALVPTADHLYAVWGSSSDDVHIGASGYFYHYDGDRWTEGDYLGSWYTKYHMWGSSATNIFTVGNSGHIFHYNGSEWTDIHDQVPVSNRLRGIWGTDSTNIYVVGDGGILLHHDGNVWTDISDPVMAGYTLYQVNGRNENDIYVCASNARVFHFSGSAWEEIADWNDLGGYQYGIWVGPSKAYSVGESGEIASYDGAEWTNVEGGPYSRLESVWAASGTDAVAVGNSGMILRYDGTSWTDEAVGDLDGYNYLGIAGEAGNLFVAGSYGVLLHNSGSGWEYISDTDVTTNYLYDVWGYGSQAIAVGDAGEAVYYDGSLFSLMTSGTTHDLNGVWGSSPSDVFAVGANGIILHYDGNVSKVWEEMDSGVTVELEDVWGTAYNNVYACGGYALLHYDGDTWERIWLDPYEWLRGIGGTAENDIYLVGNANVFHYDGTSWSRMTQTATYQYLYDVSCGADGSTFACGYEGSIIYKQP
jgi:hypothetical protein